MHGKVPRCAFSSGAEEDELRAGLCEFGDSTRWTSSVHRRRSHTRAHVCAHVSGRHGDYTRVRVCVCVWLVCRHL